MDKPKKMRAAIIGSGNIGTDLLVKCLRSPFLECAIFAGKRWSSAGIQKGLEMGVNVSIRGFDELIERPDLYDIVFDATSAQDHIKHWPVLKKLGKKVIDMTPSSIGRMLFPVVNIEEVTEHQNMSMVSCGAQASVPVAWTIKETQEHINYIEVVSSIASKSAGPATRYNMDEYIETTEKAIKLFSGCERAKAILILNPAQPCVNMQTTIYAKVEKLNLKALLKKVKEIETKVKKCVQGYDIIVPPTLENGRIVTTVGVHGSGDYLPSYAGNLDIINCVAITVAERIAQSK